MNFAYYDNLAPLLHKSDHGCFGCGSHNQCGLHMKFRRDESTIYSRVTIPDHLKGWQLLTHGGVISTILDEVMSWYSIVFIKKIILTRNLEVQFIRPVMVGSEVLASATVKEISDERNAVVISELKDKEGNLLAKANGRFATFTIEEAEERSLMDSQTLEEFAEIINTYQTLK
jgi:uncharacterized protein (TIGR00369 family)